MKYCVVCNSSEFEISLAKGIAICSKCGSKYHISELRDLGQTPSISPELLRDFIIVAGTLQRYTGSNVNVTVPEGVLEIGGLKKGESVYQAGRYISKNDTLGAFTDMCFLQRVQLPNGVVKIGNSAFRGCSSLREIILPDSLKTIEADAFDGCTSLERIVIPSSVKTIPMHCFSRCGSLKVVELRQGLEEIGTWAFSGCEALEEINLPNTLRTIHRFAFNGCKALKTFSIPNSVVEIGDVETDSVSSDYYSIFSDSFDLTSIPGADRFDKRFLKGSGWYRLSYGNCPYCNVPLSMFGNKCKKCGNKFPK